MINRDLQKVIFQSTIQEIMKAQHRVELIAEEFLIGNSICVCCLSVYVEITLPCHSSTKSYT